MQTTTTKIVQHNLLTSAGHAAASSCQLYPDKKARKKTQKQKIKNKYKNAAERGKERNKANEIPQTTKL